MLLPLVVVVVLLLPLALRAAPCVSVSVSCVAAVKAALLLHTLMPAVDTNCCAALALALLLSSPTDRGQYSLLLLLLLGTVVEVVVGMGGIGATQSVRVVLP